MDRGRGHRDRGRGRGHRDGGRGHRDGGSYSHSTPYMSDDETQPPSPRYRLDESPHNDEGTGSSSQSKPELIPAKYWLVCTCYLVII